MVFVREFPPFLLSSTAGFPLNGGRVQSVSVNPTNSKDIIVANQFGGLWKTEDGGTSWHHLGNLPTVFATDVAYGPDGKTVIATLARDNSAANGGGIWVSHDGGVNWLKPPTASPPKHESVTERISAYGISFAPARRPGVVYVGTDYGLATSYTNGDTWSHEKFDSPVFSVLAGPDDRVIVEDGHSVSLKKGIGPWQHLPWYYDYHDITFKNLDFCPLDYDKVFILSSRHYPNVTLYEISSSNTTSIPLPSAPFPESTGLNRFIRISNSRAIEDGIDVWATF